MIISRTKCAICNNTEFLPLIQIDHRKITKCRRCNFILAESFDSNALEATYANDYYPSSDAPRIGEWIESNKAVWQQLCSNLEQYKSDIKTILDVGAGTGGFLLEFHARHPETECFAIESSKEARKSLQDKINVYFSGDDADNFDGITNRFDAITLFQTLEHLNDPVKLCRTVHEKLNPDGIFMLTVPNCNSWQALLKGKAKSLCYGHTTHLQFFSDKTLSRLLTDSGFKRIVKISNFGADGETGIKAIMQWGLRYFGFSNELRYIAFK